PLVRRLPWAVLGRHVAPRRPGAQPPQDRVDHLPVITPAPTTPGRDRQQRLDPRPRRVSQLTTPHTHNPDITGHMPRTFAGQGLAVLTGQVGQSGDRWLVPAGGVGAVVVVLVDP